MRFRYAALAALAVCWGSGQTLVDLRTIRIVGAELKRVRLFEQHEVLDAHRCFACVIHSRRQFGARV